MPTIDMQKQEQRKTLCIRTQTSVRELADTIHAGYTQLGTYMGAQGYIPKEAPYVAYFNMDEDNLQIEMGFPVDREITEQGEIRMGSIPSGWVVQTIHQGPYEAMGPLYEQLFQWIKDKGLTQTGTYYEYYLNSPEEANPEELMTKLAVPVDRAD